jgi:hypothetical protein
MQRLTLYVGIVIAVLASWLSPVQAHTVRICWRAEANGTVTFFAGTYHGGTTVRGAMLVDGVSYNFTSQQTTLPGDITACQAQACTLAPPAARWLTVNVPGLCGEVRSFSTTCNDHTECPIDGCYPQAAQFCGCPDRDDDQVCDAGDNCVDVPNPGQTDSDGDGAGDACDPCPLGSDTDDDGFCDVDDNCPEVPNDGQQDQDGDGLGDICDPCPQGGDGDGDGVCDVDDNCPEAPNEGQQDQDGDGLGDICDPCPQGGDGDGDGVCNVDDNCPEEPNPGQGDADGDGRGDACDGCAQSGDMDMDGVCDNEDNCPAVANPDQDDPDGDGQGDPCDECPYGDLIQPGDGDDDGDDDDDDHDDFTANESVAVSSFGGGDDCDRGTRGGECRCDRGTRGGHDCDDDGPMCTEWAKPKRGCMAGGQQASPPLGVGILFALAFLLVRRRRLS